MQRQLRAAVSGLHELLDRHLLVIDGGGEQRREADQIRLFRQRGLDEPVRMHVGAEVDDVEAGVLEHDRHDGLADVVHVAEHRPHHERTDRLLGLGREQRADEREPRLHRAGGDEHLRDEDDLLAEAIPLEIESGKQPVVEDDPRVDARLDRLHDPLMRVMVVPFLDRLPQGLPFPPLGRTLLPSIGGLKHRLGHESRSSVEIARIANRSPVMPPARGRSRSGGRVMDRFKVNSTDTCRRHRSPATPRASRRCSGPARRRGCSATARRCTRRPPRGSS